MAIPKITKIMLVDRKGFSLSKPWTPGQALKDQISYAIERPIVAHGRFNYNFSTIERITFYLHKIERNTAYYTELLPGR